MASKRMAISALLSNDATPSRSKPSSPAPAPAPAPAPTAPSESLEPPHKRQRHIQYSQQYYESYNAYPYSHHTGVKDAESGIPASHYTGASRPSQSHWSPSDEYQQHQQWADARRYVPTPTPVGLARQERDAGPSAGRDAVVVDEHDDVHERWRQPTSMGMGESLVSVLTGQMRARQMGSSSGPGSAGLPAPPQLRRESQSQYQQPHLYATSVPVPAESQPAYSLVSPTGVKSTTPQTTPPVLSPVSAYAPTVSPTGAHPPRYPSPYPPHKMSESPTTHQAYPPQNVPHYSRPSVSPTSPYPTHLASTYTPHADSPTNSHTSHPIANYPSRHASPTPYTPVSPSMHPIQSTYSHASPGTSPTAPYILPLRPPSRPTSSRAADMPSPAPPSSMTRARTPPLPPQSPLMPTPSVSQVQTHKPTYGHVAPDEDRQFEDELLSLVDGDDVKPKITHPATLTPVPQVPSPLKSFPVNRKTSGTASKSKTKAPAKSRVPGSKSSKAKGTTPARYPSGGSTPAPGSSMPPPSPPPLAQSTKQPAVARTKGKPAGTGSSRKKATATTRSRSLSVKPPESTPAPMEVKEEIQQDDRLYCLCKTPYEEDKIMIACDRCDEWYHPGCVGMPEVEVDLVDQFICSLCSAQNRTLHTTYKPRCHRGVNHIASHDTLQTCWKPARGAFSKYCSDECGIAHMRAKIAQSGRSAAEIWPAVKNARRREGVTITHAKVNIKTEDDKTGGDMDVDIEKDMDARTAVLKAMKDADEREMSELRRRLEEVMRAREESKLALERVVTRRRLLDLAVERAGARFCGWDGRLEMGDKEWAMWVDTEAGRRALDGREGEEESDWWCQGPEACPRHRGWQTVRDHDVQLEVDTKNASIKELTDRERELRRRIEDLDPPSAPLKPHGKSGGRKKQGKKSTR